MREADPDRTLDLICLSHLRWDFVYQRPQHLMSRFARAGRVFFMEEPVYGPDEPRLEIIERAPGLFVAVPHLRHGSTAADATAELRLMLDAALESHAVREFVLWYYTPMALDFSRHLEPTVLVYDCMDELSLFRGAPATLLDREAELLGRADLVFTGGSSLWEAKRGRHASVHLFPSSIDREHFASARTGPQEPTEQRALPRPRLGFFGVIDERMDLDLLARVARARPEWQIVLIGPVVKIDPATLPRFANLHYLGTREYAELPAYAGAWDVALLPFAMNDATRFISPTKIPEYLATGVPVVSAPIADVVEPYGREGLVRIASDPEEFIAAVEAALEEGVGNPDRLRRVDGLLAGMSWDATWNAMMRLIGDVRDERTSPVGFDGAHSSSATLQASEETPNWK